LQPADGTVPMSKQVANVFEVHEAFDVTRTQATHRFRTLVRRLGIKISGSTT